MTGRTIDRIAVGDRAESTCTVTADLVSAFVTLSGDRNPIHRDATFAATTTFGEPIAPGMLSGALIAAVIGSELPGPGCIYLSQSLKFVRAVKLGDTMWIVEGDDMPAGTRVTVKAAEGVRLKVVRAE